MADCHEIKYIFYIKNILVTSTTTDIVNFNARNSACFHANIKFLADMNDLRMTGL